MLKRYIRAHSILSTFFTDLAQFLGIEFSANFSENTGSNSNVISSEVYAEQANRCYAQGQDCI